MKKFRNIALLLAALTVFFSCKKSSDSPYSCTSCTTTPDAKPSNDASSKGIYKGVVIGSTGTIKFDIQNDGSTVTAVMVLDGQTINLTSSVSVVSGQPYIAPFTGTLNGSPLTINFSVDATGENPVITSSSIPGHSTAQFELVKETSAALVEAFEGTYSSTSSEKGTFNLLLSRVLGKWKGAHRENGTSENISMDGTIGSDGKLYEDGTDYIGTLTGDVISGNFKDGDNYTITVSGNRKL